MRGASFKGVANVWGGDSVRVIKTCGQSVGCGVKVWGGDSVRVAVFHSIAKCG